MKACTKCERLLASSEFHRHKGNLDGYAYACRECAAKCKAADRQEMRDNAIVAYGGRCAVCGEDELAVLELDHINNDGRKHRADVGNGDKMYRWLRDHDYPTGIVQAMCANCNHLKTALESGTTKYARSHQKLRGDILVAYGSRCSECGESDDRLLCIVHKSGIGRHRLGFKDAVARNRYIRDLRYPSGWHLLCRNCRMRRQRQ